MLEQDGKVVEDMLNLNGKVFWAPTAPEGEVSSVVVNDIKT